VKVVIVTDWLTNMGGAERVVLQLHKMYPDAPIYTSLYDREKMPLFRNADVRASWINIIPFAKKKHQLFTLPRGWWFKHLKLNDYDLVISASGAEAKAVRTDKDTVHINYCHSPTHYYWVRPDEYLNNPGFGWFNPIMRFGLKIMLKRRRVWDYLAAQEPDIMIANSTITKQRIKKYYDRDCEVVFPPVNLSRFKLNDEKRSGFITVGRQVHYLRRDLAVIACTRLSLPLTVIGNGPEHENLRKLAGPSVKFLTLPEATDKVVAEELSKAEGFIFPGIEDFGIVAVEALSAGTPLIAIKDGGALDIVQEDINGVFFATQNVRSLMRALKHFDGSSYDEQRVRSSAQRFNNNVFEDKIRQTVERAQKG